MASNRDKARDSIMYKYVFHNFIIGVVLVAIIGIIAGIIGLIGWLIGE